MTSCDSPGCTVAALEGERFCSDHAAKVDKSVFSGGARPRRGHQKGTPTAGPTGTLRLVVAHLRRIFPRTATPVEIAASLPGVEHEAVKTALKRDQQAGGPFTVRIRRGEYRAFVDGDLMRAVDIPDPEVHNLLIVAPLTPNIPGPPFAADGTGPDHVQQRTMWWAGRRVTLQFHSGKARGKQKRRPQLAVYLRASEKPLGVQEFESYWAWCSGVLASMGVDPESPEVMVREQEINCDIPMKRIALRGGSGSMSIHGFRHGLLKVYNKKSLGAMRTEACLWPTDLHPREAVHMMEQAFFRNARPPVQAPSSQPPSKNDDPLRDYV